MDFSLDFDDLVALEEEETESFQLNPVGSAIYPQHENQFGELQIGNEDNTVEIKPDNKSSETPIQTPTKLFTCNENSTSPQALKIDNPEINLPQNLDSENTISLHKEDNGLVHSPSTGSLAEKLPTTSVFSYPTQSNHGTEQNTFENIKQQEYESQSANLVPKKLDIDSSETVVQTPTKLLTSNKSSTSPQVTCNPGIQLPQNPEYGKSISLHEEDYRLPYNPSNISLTKNPKATPGFSHPTYSSHRTEQKTFENTRQQEYGYQSSNQQSNERVEPNQKNLPLNYGQPFATNTLLPGNIPGFFPAFRNPVQQTGLTAFGYRTNSQYINFPRLQSPLIRYVTPPTVMISEGNSRIENNPEDITKIQNSPGTMRHTTTVNPHIHFSQHQPPWTGLVNKKEILESGNVLGTPEIQFMKTYPECTVQNSAESNTLKQNINRTVLQEDEMKITSDKSAQQKHAEKNTRQKFEEKRVQKKHTEKRVQHKHTKESVREKYSKKTTQGKNTKLGILDNTQLQIETTQQKNVEKTIQLDNVGKNTELDNVKKNTELDNVDKIARLENVEKSVSQNAEKNTQQDNSNVFTGKGYDSIEDFIKALFDGTLYKPK